MSSIEKGKITLNTYLHVMLILEYDTWSSVLSIHVARTSVRVFGIVPSTVQNHLESNSQPL